MKVKCIYFSLLFSYLSVLGADVIQAKSYISPGCEGRIVHTSYESSLIDIESPSNFIEFETSSSSIIEFESPGMSNFMLQRCEDKDGNLDEDDFEEEIVNDDEFVEYPADMEKAERAFKKILRMMNRQQPTSEFFYQKENSS